MKKFKKLFAVMLCLLMMLTLVISDQQAVTVQAATKMTAVKQVKTKSGKRYGYDAKGKMIKNQWGKSSSGVSIISRRMEQLIRQIRISREDMVL